MILIHVFQCILTPDLILASNHRFQMFGQWLCGKVASCLERILCGVLVKRTQGKHGCNVTETLLKHHTINQSTVL